LAIIFVAIIALAVIVYGRRCPDCIELQEAGKVVVTITIYSCDKMLTERKPDITHHGK